MIAAPSPCSGTGVTAMPVAPVSSRARMALNRLVAASRRSPASLKISHRNRIVEAARGDASEEQRRLTRIDRHRIEPHPGARRVVAGEHARRNWGPTARRMRVSRRSAEIRGRLQAFRATPRQGATGAAPRRGRRRWSIRARPVSRHHRESRQSFPPYHAPHERLWSG